jgi:nucleotide-binding universal stress UspA family protein
MKILICSDGSDQADNAIRFGGLIAAACRAETTILGITEDPSLEERVFASLRQGQQWMREQDIAAELITKAGEPVEEIVKRCRESAYDMVVIGAVRKGTRGPYWMSAKAYKIIKVVEPSVLAVIGTRTTLKRILVCSGGERYIDKAVHFSGGVARAAGAMVTLLHVLGQPPTGYADLRKIEEDVNLLLHSDSELGRNLRVEKEALEEMGVKSEVRLRHGLVISEVFKEIRGGDYDLVVTGSSPSGGNLRTYIMGNITREILNRAERPVLVVRGGEEPAGFGRSLKGLFSEITHAFGQREQGRQ